MFVAIYRFGIQSGKDEAFLEAWAELTKLIYQYENSLGSHIHRSLDEKDAYIAYAQWPDKNTWENSGNNLPEEADKWRTQMRANCSDIKTIHTLETTLDLTKKEPYK